MGNGIIILHKTTAKMTLKLSCEKIKVPSEHGQGNLFFLSCFDKEFCQKVKEHRKKCKRFQVDYNYKNVYFGNDNFVIEVKIPYSVVTLTFYSKNEYENDYKDIEIFSQLYQEIKKAIERRISNPINLQNLISDFVASGRSPFN